MKLSVCVFTYNHVEFIASTIESALMQLTNFDFEIVIGEDCSVDGTREIVYRYQQKYPDKIRAIFNAENKGMMENNIQTILNCKGDYLALLDGDDYWISPHKLQLQVDFLDSNPNYTICFHDEQILNLNGHIDKSTCCGKLKNDSYTFTDIISDVSIPTSSIMFRKSALSGYPPNWFSKLNAPDRPLYLLLSYIGPAFFIKKCWGVYRKHLNGTWTGQHYQSRWLTHLQIFTALNRHFDYKFNRHFKRSERIISYELALDLIKDLKLNRARCFFKRYIETDNIFLTIIRQLYWKSIIFYLHYLKCVILLNFFTKKFSASGLTTKK